MNNQMNSYWDEDLAILSAENVSFSIETAGLGSRLAAVGLDSLIQLLVMLFVSLVIFGLDNWLDFASNMPPFWASVAQGVFIVFTFLLMFGYFFVFEWL